MMTGSGTSRATTATTIATIRNATAEMPRRTRIEIEKADRISAARHAAHLVKTYGITAEEYRELKVYQGGVCAICLRANGARRRLAVDHDHKSGRVRGLLCRPCNRMLGHARDAEAFFIRAAVYLSRTPASELGLDRVVPDDRAVLDGPAPNQASERGD